MFTAACLKAGRSEPARSCESTPVFVPANTLTGVFFVSTYKVCPSTVRRLVRSDGAALTAERRVERADQPADGGGWAAVAQEIARPFPNLLTVIAGLFCRHVGERLQVSVVRWHSAPALRNDSEPVSVCP